MTSPMQLVKTGRKKCLAAPYEVGRKGGACECHQKIALKILQQTVLQELLEDPQNVKM